VRVDNGAVWVRFRDRRPRIASRVKRRQPTGSSKAFVVVLINSHVRSGTTIELDDPRLIMTTAAARMHLLDRKVATPDRPVIKTA
jgi:hypothetical protein